MTAYFMFVRPIQISHMKFEAQLETMKNTLGDKLEDFGKAMVTTGESPKRRIGKAEFLAVLDQFGVGGSEEDKKILDENLCFETNGEVDFDKFWTTLSS
jgi:hypothetical protein